MTSFVPRLERWSSSDLFAEVTADAVTASPEVRRRARRNLWGDMSAEYDAEHLWKHLNESGQEFTDDFRRTLLAWIEDERNHYVGMRYICSTMYGVSESEIDREMHDRKANFGPIHRFLTDEFHTLVVLAYDELVSARGYRLWFRPFALFGPEEYNVFVRRASRDEMLHFQNFADLIKLHHADRIEEIQGVLDAIVAYEERPEMEYHATFLLDHTGETLSRDFLHECAQAVRSYFVRNSPLQLWSEGLESVIDG